MPYAPLRRAADRHQREMHVPLRRSVDSNLFAAPDDDEISGESTPLIGSRTPMGSDSSMCSRCCTLTIVYFWVSAINGALVGALGPSLEFIGRNTGLSDGELGKYVLQNRLCKFAGTLIWFAYSYRMQRPGAVGRPHALFAVLMCTCAFSAFTIGTARTPYALQVGLVVSGISYGVTDSGVTALTVWRWEHEDRRRRFDLALINAGFTVGALLSPMIVAASLKFAALHPWSAGVEQAGRWVFEVISGGCVLLAITLFAQGSVTLPSSEDVASAKAEDERLGLYSPASAPSRGRRLYEASFVGAMCICLGCITGAEHGMATWLPAYGVEVGGLSVGRMALVASTYWGTMCAGRVAWTLLSGCVTSTWPMIFFDVGAALVASLSLCICTVIGSPSSPFHTPWLFEPLLWASTILLGAGVASGVPCIYSLPPEAQVQVTPIAITLLNAASTLGETCFPYWIGLDFEKKQYIWLGGLMSLSQFLALVVTWFVWRQARSRPRRRDLEFQIE